MTATRLLRPAELIAEVERICGRRFTQPQIRDYVARGTLPVAGRQGNARLFSDRAVARLVERARRGQQPASE